MYILLPDDKRRNENFNFRNMKITLRILFAIILMVLPAESLAGEFRFVKAYQWNSMREAVARDNLLYCGMDEGLQIMDISDPTKPLIVSQCVNDDNLLIGYGYERCLSQMTLYGNHLFMARYSHGLEILDVANPNEPKKVAVVKESMYKVAVDGKYVYISKARPPSEQTRGMEYALAVISIDDIRNPEIIAEVPIDGYIDDITVGGGYVFIAINRGLFGAGYVYDYPGSIVIFDINDPLKPVEVGRYKSDEPVGPIAIRDKYAFLMVGKSWLQVLDISKPSRPKLIAKRECELGGLNADIVLDRSYAFLSPCCGKNCVFDISNPKKPVLINDDPTGVKWSRFSITNGLLFASTNDDSGLPYNLRFKSPYNSPITVFDVSDPKNITMISEIGELSQFEDVAVVGDYAYLCDVKRGLKILDLSAEPGHEIVSELPFEKSDRGLLLAHDDYLYIANRSNLMIATISDILNPELVANYSAGCPISSLYVFNDYLFMGSDFWNMCDLRIVDISKPSAPELLKKINSGVERFADITIEDRFMYAASHKTGIKVFDIGDISNPIFISSYDTESAEDIEVQGGYAYVADYEAGLMIFDVSNPDTISFVTSIIPDKYRNTFYGGQSLELALRGNYAFLFSPLQNMVFSVDISDPRNPAFVGSYANFTDATHFQVTDDYIYIPSKNGLMVIEFEE